MQYQPWMRTIGRCGLLVLIGLMAQVANGQPEENDSPHPPPRELLEDFDGPEDGPPPQLGEGRGQRWRAGAMLWRRMSDEERTALRAFIAEEYPELYDRVIDVDGGGRGMFVGRILPEMIRMKELRDRDPELFKVHKDEQKTELALRRLARRYQFASSDKDRKAIAAQIRPLVEKQFDIRQRRMEEEVQRLEKRVSRVRDKIQQQADNRDAEVELMLERILEKGPRGLDEMMRGKQAEGEGKGGRGAKEAKRRGRPGGRRPHRGNDAHAVPEPDGD